MQKEQEKIREVVAAYVEGFNRGDRDALLGAFHDRGVSAGFVGAGLQWDSAADFADFCAEAAPDPHGPIPDWEIETLVVSGRTAVAVVLDRWGDRRFRDSLTLLRFDDGWRIVFKTFDGLG